MRFMPGERGAGLSSPADPQRESPGPWRHGGNGGQLLRRNAARAQDGDGTVVTDLHYRGLDAHTRGAAVHDAANAASQILAHM